ncbi:MAG: efflux RND transporter periplasmic adaptor subunit [SAR86 cluster bacterium]
MNFAKQHPIIVISLTLLLALTGLTANTWIQSQQADSGRGRGANATLVETRPAYQTILIDQIEAIGTARANESVLLTAKVTDTVRKVNFEDGQFVSQGDILVELTNGEETAQLAEAQATLDEASRQYSRVSNLIAQKLASETQLDVEKTRMQTAQARLEAILARLDDRLIRAPFSGILGFRNTSPGTLLTSSTPVTSLDDISAIKLDFAIPENYLSTLEPGQEVVAGSAAYPDQFFTGVVATINSRVDPVTRAVMVRAVINNTNKQLRPGMLLTVKLVLSRTPALVIPESAVIPIQDRQYVYVIDPQGIAQRQEITVGRRRAGIVEVLSGISVDEEVITAGVIKINPGSKVSKKSDRQGNASS